MSWLGVSTEEWKRKIKIRANEQAYKDKVAAQGREQAVLDERARRSEIYTLDWIRSVADESATGNDPGAHD